MSATRNEHWAEALHDLLVDTEDARACRDLPEQACRTSPGNFGKILVSSFLSKLGDAIANPKTVLVWVMTSVQAPVYLLGFLVPIRESGSLIPQLAIAGVVRRLSLRKWVWVTGSLLQSFAILGIGAVAMTQTGEVAGFLIIGLIVVFSLARGLCSVAAKDVLGKTIPKGQRGQLTGWSSSAAGFAAIAVGAAFAILGEASLNATVIGGLLLAAATLWIVAAGSYAGDSRTARRDGRRAKRPDGRARKYCDPHS